MNKDFFDQLREDASSADPSTREWVCFELGKSGDKRAIPILKKLLEDTHDWVREKAVNALENLNAKTVKKDIKRMRKTERNAKVLDAINHFLGTI